MTDFNFSKALNDWYEREKRELPWRGHFSPYRTWVSEIMLQQTQVVTVVGYYNRFMAAFPTVEALSKADESDVFKLWEGLGYYSRARHLMRCAKQIVEVHGGDFPNDLEALKKCPGIGPYTAGAIKSIAFNEPAPAVDGNVMRVISRVKALPHDISDPKTRIFFENEVMGLMGGSPRSFNQGLMELGALICTPKKPSCEGCPVRLACAAYAAGNPMAYPVKLKKIKKTSQKMAVVIVERENKLLILKRPSGGLMGDLWGFPVLEMAEGSEEVAKHMMSEFGLEVKLKETLYGDRHIFTHLNWEMWLLRCDYVAGELQIDYPEVLWVEKSDLKSFAFPTAFKKLFNKL